METFTITCVTLEDFVDAHDLDFFDVENILLDSEYSYGTNDDTLVGYYTLCEMLCIRPLRDIKSDVMVSLGS